jgi:hypothetical protein
MSKITESARHQSCIRCGKEGESRMAHYCGFRAHSYGKGRGIKANDEATACLCQECDYLFSEANYHAWPGGSKSIERSEEFLHYILLTIIRRAKSVK